MLGKNARERGIEKHSRRFVRLRWSQPDWAILLFCAALVSEWRGPTSIAVADGINYIHCGLNFVRSGRYLNSFGETEIWFPPLYPFLIGTLSLGGRIDPFETARVISACFAVSSLLLIRQIARAAGGSGRVAFLASIILALNPAFQQSAAAALSESVATAASLGAFLVWLRLDERNGLRSFVGLGVLAAASYLARPEGMLLLPIWIGLDLLRRPKNVIIRKYALTCLSAMLLAAPYIFWLSKEAGGLTVSGKGEVNLAAGRSEYWGTPRESIDPQTLQMGFVHYDVGIREELRRTLDNWRKIFGAYSGIYRWPEGAGLLALMIVGFSNLVRGRKWRFLGGLAGQAAYLPFLAFYAVQTRYLHATLPALSLLAAFGVDVVQRDLRSARNPIALRLAAGALLLCSVVAITEGGTRMPRWALISDKPEATILMDAGRALATLEPAGGVVYEAGATIGYYAHRKRRRLTRNHLDTITEYIRSREREEPVWLALSSLQIESYDPSVRSLLDTDRPGLERVLELQDERGRVAVFRVH